MSDSKTDFVNFVNQMAAENDTESFLRMTENPDARDFGPASTKKLFANAPFESVEEMLSISGISAGMLEAAIMAYESLLFKSDRLLDKKSAEPGEKPEESNPQYPKESKPKKPEGNGVITKEKKPKKKNYEEFEVNGQMYVTVKYENLKEMMEEIGPVVGKRVMIWINAFIPSNTTGVTPTPPGFIGKASTKIEGPFPWPFPGSDCFLTDNRLFSNIKAASVRMQSVFYGHIVSRNTHLLWCQEHRCGETVEIDCGNGAVKGRATASTDRMKCKVTFFNGIHFEVSIVGAANNPLFKMSPDIDYNVTYVVFPGNGRPKSGYVWCKGKVDEYPNFESYVARNFKGPGITIFQKPHAVGATPKKLSGGAVQPVHVSVGF